MVSLKEKLLDWVTKKALKRQEDVLENLSEDEVKEKIAAVDKIIKKQEEIMRVLDKMEEIKEKR